MAAQAVDTGSGFVNGLGATAGTRKAAQAAGTRKAAQAADTGSGFINGLGAEEAEVETADGTSTTFTCWSTSTNVVLGLLPLAFADLEEKYRCNLVANDGRPDPAPSTLRFFEAVVDWVLRGPWLTGYCRRGRDLLGISGRRCDEVVVF